MPTKLFLFIVVLSFFTAPSSALTTRAEREAREAYIKSLPITERPNRRWIRHPYGNSVRKRHFDAHGIDFRSVPVYRPYRGVMIYRAGPGRTVKYLK